MSADEYKALVEGEVVPLYEEMKRRAVEDQLVQPKVAYGYFPCYSEGDALFVEDQGTVYEFPFPRQAEPPYLSIPSFFKAKKDGGDVAGFFVVTIGPRISEESHRLYEADNYHDYLMLHGFSVEITDALAEYWHEMMRNELGIGQETPDSMTGYAVQEYQGSRYGFGYPACPDLDAHKHIFKLLDPESIGITLTENMEMVPEQSTSALVAHHPQAKYFAV